MKHQSITELPPSPEAERRARMIKYTIAMSIRVACIFALLFVQGWWLVVFAAGAIVLPYIAVVIANVSGPTRNTAVLRPGGLVAVGSPQPDGGAPDSEDAPPESDGGEPEPESGPATTDAPETGEPDTPEAGEPVAPTAGDPDDERGAA